MEILTLGEKIKKRRKQLSMTLKDLAGDRITAGQISLVESGKSNPSIDLLEYLASRLNISVQYLLETEEVQVEKISIYYEQIAESYIIQEDYEKAKQYIDDTLNYLKKYNLEDRRANFISLNARLNMFEGNLSKAQELFLISNVTFIKNNRYEDVINTFIYLTMISLETKSYNLSLSYLNKAEDVYMDNDIADNFLLAKIYYFKAETHYRLENLVEAKRYTILSTEKFDEVYNEKEYAKKLLETAQEWKKKGKITSAIGYSTKALEVNRGIKRGLLVSRIEDGIGRLFFDFEDIDKSFTHYYKSKGIRTRMNDPKVVDTLINIATNYITIKDLNNAHKVLQDIEEKLDENDIVNIIESHVLWYKIYDMQGRYEDAFDILDKAYNLAVDNNLSMEAAKVSILISKLQLDNKNEPDSEVHLRRAINILKDLGKIRD